LLATLLSLMVASCQIDFEEDLGTLSQTVIGGNALDAAEFDEVCSMAIIIPPDDEGDPRDPITCTCVLVGKDGTNAIILTSAECVDENLDANTLGDIIVTFGPFVSSGTNFNVLEVELHRYFDDDQATLYELAMVRLDGVPAEGTAAISTRSLTASDIGGTLTLLGFGETEDSKGDVGTLRALNVTIDVVGPLLVRAGDVDLTTCDGDSGGPGFIDNAGTAELATINVISGRCFENAARTRTDIFNDSFIFPYIDRFIGVCKVDGTCTTTGCRTPDPDCNECSWGNTCKEDCPSRDWDCPLGSFNGDACTKDGDCEEFGRCIAADDESDFTYCAKPCDPADNESCKAGMECRDNGSGNECSWLTPSPGSQGATCSVPVECRSGICEDTICVNICQTQADCVGDFTCAPSKTMPGTMACLGQSLTGGGGFCAIAPAGTARARDDSRSYMFLFALLLGVAFVSRRRRKTR